MRTKTRIDLTTKTIGIGATAVALLVGALGGCAPPGTDPEEADVEETVAADEALTQNNVLDWRGFAKPNGKGIATDVNGAPLGKDFADPFVRAMNATFSVKDGEQWIVAAWKPNAANDQGNVSFTLRTLKNVKGGQHFKAWLLGSVRNSNNVGMGFCGAEAVSGANGNLKEPFRAQVQMQFADKNGKFLGLCYCNVCPAKDGDLATCSTDQWHLPANEMVVSDDGACQAPKGTSELRLTIEAVAKRRMDLGPGDAIETIPPGKGTAVIKAVRLARCKDDGRCPDSLVPDFVAKQD